MSLALSDVTNTQTNTFNPVGGGGGGVVSRLIRNVNYLCIICVVVCFVVCLFGLVGAAVMIGSGGSGVRSVTLETLTSSAVKWRNVFKASSDFYWSADHFIIHRCVCVCTAF